MKLIAVTNDRWPIEKLGKIMVEAEPFVDHFIIREKSKTADECMKLIQFVLNGGVSSEKLIINDRIDVAVAANIRKVHLPGHGLDVQMVKSRFPRLLAGCSVHSAAEADQAIRRGADWILYGHVFETASKRHLPPRGLQELSEIAEKHDDTEIYAIGGIQPKHILQLNAAGAAGIAVMSSIFDSEVPVSAAESYHEACQFII
ncbi:thiamine phosphate synthase [Siminovitchia sp. 179-K 8D1 HS]|uniref:thiamine phosphate synthase n=1 Tax=Siminovitchia sp. 179-K 8D1 HS TaxID=3142385 RepID=UPI0039A25129